MPLSRLRRPGLGVATTTALVALAATAPSLAAPSTAADPDAARDAATWLAREFTDGALPGPFGGQDWGLTIDGLLALTAADVAEPTRRAATEQVAAHVRSYNSYDDWGIEGFTDGGATAKLLYAATAAGAEPTDFGGFDLRAETLALVAGADSGDQRGRITSRTTDASGPDASNTFDQAFAVLGLARSGELPQDTVDFLVRQQCAVGGFRLYPDADDKPTCDAQATPTLDVDSTAMAVQALLTAAEDGATGAAGAARRGADWLQTQQQADGSFGGSGPTSGTNANSTGLAAQALAAAGRDTAATRAAAALVALQLTTATGGAAAADAGAIAYNAETLTAARTSGLGENDRDQWRRATAQALLGLAQVPLGRIGLDPPVSPSPSPSITASPTPSGSPSPSGSATPTLTPSHSDSPTPPTPTPTATTPSATPSTTPVGGGLPTTGASVITYLLVALLLIGGGTALVVLTRRRAT
ncbi:cell wall anchor protein [Micromonospora echinospora]|uniref:Prenyltransferase-like n=1 Tax=Micromonospora echinospora TaxID=1877 RepID=A0A1C4ZIV6_MICEC|nr:cell wall anchor protein [Micromonospora echinospora]OZV77005.1 cell wall anchor protein [Micromonospora echinospora]SCF32776.1 Prenyltransferase-like [Micromonospora echinospora]